MTLKIQLTHFIQSNSFQASPNEDNDCSGAKVQLTEEPFDQIRKMCGFPEPVSAERKQEVGKRIVKSYLKDDHGGCPPLDIMDGDYGEIDVKLNVGKDKKRKFLDDSSFEDEEWNKKYTEPDDFEKMRKYLSHLWPADLIESDMPWFLFKFNEQDPEKLRGQCGLCLNHKKRFHLKDRFLSDFAKDKGVNKGTIFANEDALLQHQTSVSHLVVESEMKKEKEHKLGQELGLLMYEDHANVVTNKYMRLNYNGNHYKVKLIIVKS